MKQLFRSCLALRGRVKTLLHSQDFRFHYTRIGRFCQERCLLLRQADRNYRTRMYYYSWQHNPNYMCLK